MKMNNLIDRNRIRVVIEDISWERIHLSIIVRVETSDSQLASKLPDFYAVDKNGQAQVKFKTEKLEEGKILLKVNVTNTGKKEVIPIGTYCVVACLDENVIAECEVDEKLVYKLEDLSRGYIYKRQNFAYNIKFYVANDETALKFRIRTLNSERMELEFPKNPNFPWLFAKLVKQSFFDAHVVVRLVYQFFSLIYKKKRKNNVLFLTEQSKTIKSNLKAVKERMEERGLDKKFKISTSARKVADKTDGGLSWIKLAITLAKNGIIFVDDHAPVLDWLLLGKDVKVIQLWHAGAGFKSSGYSRWGQDGPPGPISAHRQYTYGISGSKRIAPFFSEVWGINDECVLPTGMPRMDEFLDEEFRAKKTAELREKYPMTEGKKVILFGPTYRGNSAKDAYYPYQIIDFKKLYEVCGDEYIVFFKMHPWVIEDIQIPEEYKDKFFDVKKYPNINDLFYITDLLITDYSSNIFEYSLMRKPMLFFAYDKIQYAFSRGFHRAYEESAPGKVVYTFEQLLQAIEKKDFEAEKVDLYVEHHFDHIDSHASDRVIDWTLLGQMPEEIKADIEKINKEMKHMSSLDFLSIME